MFSQFFCLSHFLSFPSTFPFLSDSSPLPLLPFLVHAPLCLNLLSTPSAFFFSPIPVPFLSLTPFSFRLLSFSSPSSSSFFLFRNPTFMMLHVSSCPSISISSPFSTLISPPFNSLLLQAPVSLPLSFSLLSIPLGLVPVSLLTDKH